LLLNISESGCFWIEEIEIGWLTNPVAPELKTDAVRRVRVGILTANVPIFPAAMK
jgi:hypothetical protein